MLNNISLQPRTFHLIQNVQKQYWFHLWQKRLQAKCFLTLLYLNLSFSKAIHTPSDFLKIFLKMTILSFYYWKNIKKLLIHANLRIQACYWSWFEFHGYNLFAFGCPLTFYDCLCDGTSSRDSSLCEESMHWNSLYADLGKLRKRWSQRVRFLTSPASLKWLLL